MLTRNQLRRTLAMDSALRRTRGALPSIAAPRPAPLIRWHREPRDGGLPTKQWSGTRTAGLGYVVERWGQRRPHRYYEVSRFVGSSTHHTLIGRATTLRAAQRIAAGDVLLCESGAT